MEQDPWEPKLWICGGKSKTHGIAHTHNKKKKIIIDLRLHLLLMIP